MKLYSKLFLVAMGCATLNSCSDMDDINGEGFRVTSEQIENTNELIPSRVESSLVGMYHYMGTQYAGAPTSGRDDDFGYPTACISQDLNGADMVCDNSSYNWFSVSSDYSDRNETYANPQLRYSYFYNQLKLANDILSSIDPNTEDDKLKQYIGEAKPYVLSTICAWHLTISSTTRAAKTNLAYRSSPKRLQISTTIRVQR